MRNKLRTNQAGLAHLVLILLIVVVVGAVGFAGWKVMNHNKKSNSSNTSGTTTSSNTASSTAVDASCLATYHDATLCHFASSSTTFDKMAYTATLTATQSGATSTMTLQNDGKGNTSLNMTGNGATVDSIQLNGKTYVKSSASATWMEYDSAASAQSTGVSDPTSNMDIAVGATGLTFKNLGTEACGSLTCYKYQITDKTVPGTQYVWFDNGSYKLRRWQFTNGGDSTDMVISYAAVNITTPSPVQSVSQMMSGQ